jgi:hypothetical protein
VAAAAAIAVAAAGVGSLNSGRDQTESAGLLLIIKCVCAWWGVALKANRPRLSVVAASPSMTAAPPPVCQVSGPLPTSVRMPPDLVSRLDAQAQRLQTSRSRLLLAFAARGVEDLERTAAA